MWEKNDIGLHQRSTFWWIYISTDYPVCNIGYHYHTVLLLEKVVLCFLMNSFQFYAIWRVFLKNILRSQNTSDNFRASTVNWRRANLHVMCNKFNRIKSSSRSLFNVNIICSSVCKHVCTIYINTVYYTGWSFLTELRLQLEFQRV